MCQSGDTHSCLSCCIRHQLKLLDILEGQPQVEHSTVVHLGDDQGMSDCEQSLPVQELVHNTKYKHKGIEAVCITTHMPS